jgi:hypothetical protein
VRREEPNVTIWCGDIDDELTAKGYIVPGLGDAGDLAFGTKAAGLILCPTLSSIHHLNVQNSNILLVNNLLKPSTFYLQIKRIVVI